MRDEEMSIRDIFELINDLCNVYGMDRVESTINSMFETIRCWNEEE